jgi:hypothetical protein
MFLCIRFLSVTPAGRITIMQSSRAQSLVIHHSELGDHTGDGTRRVRGVLVVEGMAPGMPGGYLYYLY